MLILNAAVFNGSEFIRECRVRIRDGKITETGAGLLPEPGEASADLEGDYLLPGFVDVHIHAFSGRDTMQGEEAVRAMSRELLRLGVAAFCPTTMSADPEETRTAIEGIRAVMDRPEPAGARVLVNRGGARPQEVLDLAGIVTDRVRERYGIDLQPEVRIADSRGFVDPKAPLRRTGAGRGH